MKLSIKAYIFFLLVPLILFVGFFLFKNQVYKTFFKAPHSSKDISVQFINEQVLDKTFVFEGIRVGGLSALVYHLQEKKFFALSDDKGKHGDPRFYELSLQKNQDSQYQLNILKMVFLRTQNGDPFKPLDPEGIALFLDELFISSEGAQLPNLKAPPGIFKFDRTGAVRNVFPLPSIFWPKDLALLGEWGVKENKAFEALSVDSQNKQIWMAVENSLHQDQHQKNKQFIRFSQFDIEQRTLLNQYVYEMEIHIKKGLLKGLNGLTDFYFLGNKQFIVIERAYLKNNSIPGSEHRKTDANLVKLFLADCSNIESVLHYDKLLEGSFQSCKKTLLSNLSSLLGDITVDNIEGIALGPVLSPKSRLLVLVSDNNFNISQKTQFLFFELFVEDR